MFVSLALAERNLTGASIATAFGATFVAAVDINADRVAFATREGFTQAGHVLPMGPRPKDSAESLVKAKETAADIMAAVMPDGEGFDVVLECTGVESCMQTAIHVSCRPQHLGHNAETIILIVCQNRREGSLHRNGYAQCNAASQCCCFPRGGYDWRVPVLQYLPGRIGTLRRGQATQCRQASHNTLQARKLECCIRRLDEGQR